ncbi:MAG: UDP-N-acetylglucosamine 1-carboxyvinyltransferase [Ignavibacteriales bacterium]|nr:UDP-N-acetylglucosamine 1-carboxyvinyltransferase [Ignavibacteriaceae bacterium]MCK6612850.1 UDP-N-acetylglucosamine 1-carboxyvinyltransferase [Ignavibacteriaceae bacterium]QOJ29431.1 MAG: UDP-N-acetylglucosamine 1-carboxyvinyltransferase [Ignavibacteriales bacterium]
MDKLIIEGGHRLTGEISISGAKNASLALMPAALLANGVSVFSNTPELNDVYTMIKIMRHLGAEVSFADHVMHINTSAITSMEAPYELVKKMRASFYVLGPLLAKYGYAKVSLPGGCAWGPRPINLHLEGLKKLGAEIELDAGYIIARSKKLTGAKINFDKSSVGATGNVLMAAVLARGTTVINNAAMEPEISNLAHFLNKMGARISGIESPILTVEGVDELKPAEIATIPDRIEAGTLMIAAAMTRGSVTFTNINDNHLIAVLARLEDAGAKVLNNNGLITISSGNEQIIPSDVTTSIFPGFPTDMQAQWMAYMTTAAGTSTITDTIYLDRFSHVAEINRLGADITVKENSAIVRGVNRLKGAKVMSTDLRASASLVLAGLVAEGSTEVLRVYHLDRGYEKLEEKLNSLGARIQRVAGSEY